MRLQIQKLRSRQLKPSDQIKASGKLKIGTEGTYAPFTFHDKDGKLTGFDVEIAQEVSKRLGVEPEFIETPWDGIFAGLDAKRFDAVFNEVTIRDDRKAKYDFSDSYIVSKAVLLVNEDNTDITTDICVILINEQYTFETMYESEKSYFALRSSRIVTSLKTRHGRYLLASQSSKLGSMVSRIEFKLDT